MNIVNGFDIDTPEGATAYLESEGVDVDQCVKDGLAEIEKIKARVGTENIEQAENKASHIGGVVRSFMEELGKGVEDLGASIQKSGVLPHLIAFWCMAWGVIGFFISLIWIFG